MKSGWISHSKESRNKVAAMCGVFFTGGSDYVKPHRFANLWGFQLMLLLTKSVSEKVRQADAYLPGTLMRRF